MKGVAVEAWHGRCNIDDKGKSGGRCEGSQKIKCRLEIYLFYFVFSDVDVVRAGDYAH